MLTDGPVISSPVMYVAAAGLWEAGVGSADTTEYWWIPEGQLGDTNSLPADAPIHAPISTPELGTESVWYRATDDGTLAKRIFEGNNRAAWTFETDGTIRTTPALTEDIVYTGSWDGDVYAIDADEGAQQWQFQTGARVQSSPAVAAGTVYIGSDTGSVYALDGKTGEAVWTVETDGGSSPPPPSSTARFT